MNDSEDKLSPHDSLTSRGFVALLVTQFLTALNDNLFRWLVVPIGQKVFGVAEALSLGLACFTVPYLVLAPFAAYLADRFSKRSVIVACKVTEIVIMTGGILAILFGQTTLLFVIVALMGGQSALFSPARMGSIPEILSTKRLSNGNGLMGLATIIACAIGTAGGYALYDFCKPPEDEPFSFSGIQPIALALLGVAIFGWLASLLIPRLTAACPTRQLSWNPFAESLHDLQLLYRSRALFRTAIGIAFFWMLASLANLNIDPFGETILGLKKVEIGRMLGVLVIGVGLGSVLAGIWSGGRVELGIVPLGATGITVSSLCLYYTGQSVSTSTADIATNAPYIWSCVWLFFLGVSAGLFNVPLESFLQHNSPAERRGTIIAGSNVMTFSSMLLVAGLFYVMHKKLALSPAVIFLIAGLGTVPVIIYIFLLLPNATIRFIVWLVSRIFYKVRVRGLENLPETGPALIVPNHVSWIDGFLLIITSSRNVRMIVYSDYIEGFGIRWLARVFGAIPIKAGSSPRAIVQSLQAAKEGLLNGDLVCIFPEGGLTRTGQLQAFQRGVLKIVKGTGAPIVPTYLDGLWGSIFSFYGGKFFWKWPRFRRHPVGIYFGEPIEPPEDVEFLRCAIQELSVEAVKDRKELEMVPPRLFIRQCRHSLFREKLADSAGATVTGAKLLIGTLAFRRLLRRTVFNRTGKNVGILLPPSVGGALANAATSLSGKVAVNLNYTLDDDVVNFCIRQAEIQHVLTSRRFLEKRPMNIEAELVYLEDLKEKVSSLDKFLAMFMAFCVPAFLLDRMLGLTRIHPHDLLTIIFTSGSTGEPKGVMLSQSNIASNIEAVNQVFQFDSKDVVLGVLPFFHSFGYTGTLWLPLALDPKAAYHFNPLDSRQVGKLAQKHGASIIMATPTFLKNYLRRCSPEEFHKLDLAIVGAEKLPGKLAEDFQEKFGVLPVEGYGTTELSPVAAFNVPENRAGTDFQRGNKAGSVGRVMPGAAAKVVHPDTGEDLGSNQEGLLYIKGPNVMLGYLKLPEKTAEVIRDGWYNTGDIAKIDEEGFIELTGRLSRFSKIGGEMVPHVRIEEELARIVDEGDDESSEIMVAVTSVPDEKKGERLIVLHRPFSKPIDQVLQELAATGIPNIWLPSRDSFLQVETIPILGTGKLDLRGIQALALELTSRKESPANS